MLVRCESLVNVLCKQVAVTKGCPRGTIVGVMTDELSVVLDRLLVISSRSTEFGHLAQARDRADVPVLLLSLLLNLLLLLLDLQQVLV